MRPRINTLVVCVGLVILASLTQARSHAWQSTGALCEAALRTNPHSAFALWRLGTLAYQQNDRPRARQLFRQARTFIRHGDGDILEKYIWFFTDLVGE